MTVKFSGQIRAQVIQPDVLTRFSFTAGEAITSGQFVAKGETDGRVYKAKADDSTRMPAIGCAVSNGGAGETVYITPSGVISSISGGGSFSRDQSIFVSKTAGQATNTPPEDSGDLVQYVGRSINATDVMLNISELVIKVNP